MTDTIQDVMRTDVMRLEADRPISEAARLMRDEDIGDVLVMREGELAGIVTDRDIVVRCIATGAQPESTPLEAACSRELTTLAPDADVDEAVRLMAERAIRRIPVVEDGELRGIVSLGDLAALRDRRSALGGISAAAPNR